ncbi:MAG: TapB family protein [Candidatus Binataceae bacterium]
MGALVFIHRREDRLKMCRRIAVLMVLALAIVPLMSCEKAQPKAVFDPAMARSFFPLEANATWTYQIKSKSQRKNYVVTDRVIGVKYVPSLNVTGEVVEEYYNMDRGGTRPIVYVAKNGYLTRLSGLDYKKKSIEAPAWGRSEDGMFLPQRLTPNLVWSNTIFPFGHMPGSFDIKQTHRTYFEAGQVEVPAGHFHNCIRIETQAKYEGGTYAKMKGNMRLIYKDWYAPHVGLIKTVAFEGGPNGHLMEQVELIRFDIPKSKTVANTDTTARAGASESPR